MEILTDVLNTLELKGWLCSRTEIVAPWRFQFAASQDSTFHIFNFGGGYLCIEGESTPLPVKDGDMIVLPYGHAHSICDELTSPLTKLAQLDYDEHREYEVFPFEGEGTKTVLLCGVFHFDHPGADLLLHCLPKIIHIPGEQERMAHGLGDIMGFIARESASLLPGTEVMLRRLTEMLFIQVIRVWIAQQTQTNSGWLGALSDPQIGPALGLIHQSPQRKWKVEELAGAVALSRSAFSTRFATLVGEPPLRYLTRWRMHMATRLLKNNVQMEKVAQQLGYDSEAAFRKAFKREVGIPPARYRKLR